MKARHGFSLVEVLVAIAVLGVILVAVAGLMTGNLGLRRQSNQATEAAQLAASYMDSIKRHWSVLENYVDADVPGPPTEPRAARYDFVLNINCVDLQSNLVTCGRDPVLRQVRINVSNSATGDSESLVTLIGRPFDSQGNQ